MNALSQCNRNIDDIRVLEDLPDDETIHLFETRNGFSLLYQKLALHHPEDAITETKQLVSRDLHPGKDNIHLLFGLGIGYLLEACYEQSEGAIVVYEPHLPLLKFLITNIDFSEYFADPRVSLCITPDDLRKNIFFFVKMQGFLDGLILPGYGDLFDPEVLKEAKSQVETAIKTQQGYFRIGLALNPDWQQTVVKNIPLLANAYDASPLIEFHHGKPAIVVSAGPSLDRNIEQLRRCRDHVVLIAVGAALKPLMSEGIQPDYLTFLDYDGPQYQLAGQNTQNIQLILGPFVHELAWQVPCRRRYFVSFSNYGQLSNWQDEHLGICNAKVGSGGSVSIMSTHVAIMMGCSPVILLGQDLAFSGTQQYAGNVHVTMEGENFTAPASHVHEGRTLPYATIQGQQGETLLTSPDYVTFQTQFSDLADNYLPAIPGLQLINASIGGALLPGFQHEALSNLADRLGWAELTGTADPMTTKPLPLAASQKLNPEAFAPSLQNLQQQVNRCLTLGDRLMQQQRRWKRSVVNHGPSQPLPEMLETCQSDFVEAVQTSWVVYGCLGHEIWVWQDVFLNHDVSITRIQREMDCVQSMLDKLTKGLKPALESSIATLALQKLSHQRF